MLNRRILRLKTLKALYAVKQAREAMYEIALDQIFEHFEPDLNQMDIPDPEDVAANRKSARTLFVKNYLTTEITDERDAINVETKEVAQEAMDFYHQQLRLDRHKYKQQMLEQTDEIYDTYLSLLKLVIEFADFAKQEYNERLTHQVRNVVILKSEIKLNTNAIIEKLRQHPRLQQLFEQKRMEWTDEQVRNWYKILKADETYQKYQALPEVTFEQDKEIVEYLVKSFILKHDVLVSHIEEEDLHWQENKAVVRNMLVKTLKPIEEDTEVYDIELYRLSNNWEDDRQFFAELYDASFRYSDLTESILIEKSKNWDIERIALMDKLILKMAVAEMIHFPSIPIKVTINEYVELAKNYSTPKSKEFINGMLDMLSKELQETGKIKKSGRGLIDNK